MAEPELDHLGLELRTELLLRPLPLPLVLPTEEE